MTCPLDATEVLTESSSLRMERWERAEKLNLDPPADVFKILKDHDEGGKFTECVWERLV